MRSSRVVGLFVVVALLVTPVVASVTPSKVCHPKKPVTCRATVLADQSAKPAVKAQPVQQAMVCTPVPRWICRADTLNSAKPAVKAQPVQQAMVCTPVPRWICRADTLNSVKPAVKAQPVQQAMVCGYLPRWANTLS